MVRTSTPRSTAKVLRIWLVRGDSIRPSRADGTVMDSAVVVPILEFLGRAL